MKLSSKNQKALEACRELNSLYTLVLELSEGIEDTKYRTFVEEAAYRAHGALHTFQATLPKAAQEELVEG